MIRWMAGIIAASLLPVLSAHAAVVTVDCNKKGSINVELAKLDKSAPNTLRVTGVCRENVLIDGHRDLTISRINDTAPAYEIAATAGDLIVVTGGSRVTFDLAMVFPQAAGQIGLRCEGQSTCRLTTQARFQTSVRADLIRVQDQSILEIVDSTRLPGDSYFSSGGGRVLGVLGGSSANLRFTSRNATLHSSSPDEVISVQDGSFLRVDNGGISMNSGTGVMMQRGAVVKLLNTYIVSVGANTTGIRVVASSLQFEGTHATGQLPQGTSGIALPISIGALGFVRVGSYGNLPLPVGSSTGGFGVSCDHPTAVVQLRNVDLGSGGTNCTNY